MVVEGDGAAGGVVEDAIVVCDVTNVVLGAGSSFEMVDISVDKTVKEDKTSSVVCTIMEREGADTAVALMVSVGGLIVVITDGLIGIDCDIGVLIGEGVSIGVDATIVVVAGATDMENVFGRTAFTRFQVTGLHDGS